MQKGTIVFYFYFKESTRIYISNKKELNDIKAIGWTIMQAFYMMLFRIFDKMGKYLYFNVSKKRCKIIYTLNGNVLPSFCLVQWSSNCSPQASNSC